MASLKRILRPTIADCLVIWLLVGLCFGAPMALRIRDNDVWWHLRTGQIITETHTIPHADPFSFTMAGKPWVAHEWLSEVVFWLAYSKAGFAGVCLLRSLLIFAVFCVVFATVRRRTPSFHAAIIATAISALVSCASWSERPQLFGYLCLAILLWLIQRYRRGSSLWPVIPLFVVSGNPFPETIPVHRGASLWPVIPLFTLWINLHGSWLIGMAVLVWTGIGAGYDAFRSSKTRLFIGFAAIVVLAVAALFINPSPLTYVAYPFQYLGATHHTEYISEWQGPDFHEPAFAAFAAVLLGMGLLLRASRAKLDPFESILVLGLAGASLYSLRHIPVFAIVSAGFLAEHIAAVQLPIKSKAAQKELAEPILLRWTIILALPLLIYLRLPNGGRTPYLNVKDYPARAFDHISKTPPQPSPKGEGASSPFFRRRQVRSPSFRRGLGGGRLPYRFDNRLGHSHRLLTNYNWGGYAIYRMWPDYSIYIDGRADLYGTEMIKRVKKLDGLKPGWKKELERAKPDVIVWPRDWPLTEALKMSPEWREVKMKSRDKIAAIFVPIGRGNER